MVENNKEKIKKGYIVDSILTLGFIFEIFVFAIGSVYIKSPVFYLFFGFIIAFALAFNLIDISEKWRLKAKLKKINLDD